MIGDFFLGGGGQKRGGPKRAILGHYMFSVLLFFPALTDPQRRQRSREGMLSGGGISAESEEEKPTPEHRHR